MTARRGYRLGRAECYVTAPTTDFGTKLARSPNTSRGHVVIDIINYDVITYHLMESTLRGLHTSTQSLSHPTRLLPVAPGRK